FTFAAFCYMLSLVLCVSLIFFAIWHITAFDELQADFKVPIDQGNPLHAAANQPTSLYVPFLMQRERLRNIERICNLLRKEFCVEVGLHQESAPSPFLYTMMMDRLTDKGREQVEEKFEPWRFVLERRVLKVSRSKTEYMCVNERDPSGRLVSPEYSIHGLLCIMFLCAQEWLTVGLNIPLLFYNTWRSSLPRHRCWLPCGSANYAPLLDAALTFIVATLTRRLMQLSDTAAHPFGLRSCLGRSFTKVPLPGQKVSSTLWALSWRKFANVNLANCTETRRGDCARWSVP
ncbi:unnamed protein product, partial [Tetraodon nigroviridis]